MNDRKKQKSTKKIIFASMLASLLCCSVISKIVYASDGTELAVWTNEAIIATYTFDDKNFLSQQKEIAHYFTADGWIAYSKALDESKLIDSVKENHYRVSAVATLPPTVTAVGHGTLKAVMPILVVYQNPQYQQKQNLEVTILFSPVKSGGVRGLAISSLQAAVVTPSCRCPT